MSVFGPDFAWLQVPSTIPLATEVNYLSLATIEEVADGFLPTGSYYICDPPVMDADKDYVVYVTNMDRRIELERQLVTAGWERGGSFFENTDDPASFVSLRHDSRNIILTENLHDFDGFRAATALAKRLNLTNKADRIALFQAVRYHKICETKT